MNQSRPPLGFAHRGGAVQRAEQNSLAAFEGAVARGATAIESDVALTVDGIAVLVHPGIRQRLRRPVSRLRRADLPASVPSVEDVYRAHGDTIDIALDMAAPAAVEQVVELARHHGDPGRLWLTYWRLPVVRRWRRQFPDARLVFPTLFLRGGEDGLRRMRDAGVDAVNLHHRACAPARVAAIHAQEMLVFAWGIGTGPVAQRALRNGVDGVFCDDVPGMVAALAAESERRAISAATGS